MVLLHLDAHTFVRHDVDMRTTLTLEPDVVLLLQEATRRDGLPLKEIVNAALRRGLAPPGERRRFVVEPHHTTLRAGIDPGRMHALLDELAIDDALPLLAAEPDR
jgi:hypothetical protein